MMATSTLPLFYKSPRPLAVERDSALSFRAPETFAFAAATNSVPLLAAEFASACKHFPIVFTEGPSPQPVALLGLRTGENLFVDQNGAWQEGVYIPAYIRRYPFIFMENTATSEFTLCIDEASGCLVDGQDNPFFADGKPTEMATKALDFLREFQGQHAFTVEFMTAVYAAGLLTEKRADITLKDGQIFSLSGFMVIDEDLLNKVPADEFQRWRERGWLGVIYAHLLSVRSWSTLLDWVSRRG
ncbi:MAG: SapC family protein [Rhodospirillaceae bacterium]